MIDKDVHELIEQQNPEAKQSIWKKIRNILSERAKQSVSTDEGKSDNNGKRFRINKIIRK